MGAVLDWLACPRALRYCTSGPRRLAGPRADVSDHPCPVLEQPPLIDDQLCFKNARSRVNETGLEQFVLSIGDFRRIVTIS